MAQKETVQFNRPLPADVVKRLQAERERLDLTWEEFFSRLLDLSEKRAA